MRKIVLLTVSAGLFLFSCGSKNETVEGELSEEQIEALEENAQINLDQIKYEGTYKGKIQGKEIVLKLEDDSFELTENGQKVRGAWSKIDDGTVIELEPKSGKVSIRHYNWSDNDTWVAMEGKDSLFYLEPEQYLKRVSD